MTIYLTPPRTPDGRYAPMLEIGVARAMTAALRAALGYPDPDSEPPEVKSVLGGIGHIARHALGGITWDPTLHPRDSEGRFVNAGDRVAVDTDGPTPTIGQVVGNTPTSIIVSTPSGKAEVDPAAVRVVGLAGPARTLARVPATGSPTGTGTITDPIDVGDDLAAAAALIASGKHVRLHQPQQVSTLVTSLHDMIDAPTVDGKPAVYNLALVTVPGTNLFQGGTLERIDMPQLTGVPLPGSPAAALPVAFTGTDGRDRVTIQPGFLDALRDRGIAVTTQTTPASMLRPTQRELSGTTVADVLQRVREGTYVEAAPIIATRDGYILDGHHRWAAQVAADTEHGGDTEVTVDVIDLDIGAALDMAREYSAAMGLPARHAWPPHPPTKWDATVGDRWRHSATPAEAKMLADLTETTADGYTSVLLEARINPTGHIATASGDIVTENGSPAGTYRIAVNRDSTGLSLNLDHIIMFPNHRGWGFGTDWFRQMVAAAREQGVDRITLEANLDVGGYVWAVRGFDWDPQHRPAHAAHTWPDLADALISATRGADPSTRAEARLVAGGLRAAAADPDVEPPSPRDVALVGAAAATTPDGGVAMWPGKKALLGTSWHGVLDLEQPVNALTQADTVTDVGPIRLGRREAGGPVDATEVTIFGAPYARLPDGTLRRQCDRCDPPWSGSVSWSPLDGGRCWGCGGTGVVGPTYADADAVAKRERRLAADRARRAHAAQVKAEKAKAAAAQWAAEHPDLAAGLAEVRDILDAHDAGTPAPRVDNFVASLARQAAYKPLSPRQTEALADALAEYRRDAEEWAEEQAEKDATRWVGDVGSPVTVTGVVDAVVPVEGRYGWSNLVIVRGTGDDDGAVIKTFTTAQWSRDIERGDTVTVTGTVRAHDTRDGVRQTQIASPKRVDTKALGTIATTPMGVIRWDPALHPRDEHGQWTETLGHLGLPSDTAPGDVYVYGPQEDEDVLGELVLGSLLGRVPTRGELAGDGYTEHVRRKAKKQSARAVAEHIPDTFPAADLAAAFSLTPAELGDKPDAIPERVRHEAAKEMIYLWATTANDRHWRALLMQDAARDEFALDGTADWHTPVWDRQAAAARRDAKRNRATCQPAYQALLRAEYDATQAWLRARNIGPDDMVDVYRGVKGRHDPPLGDDVTLTMRPMSSWTYDPTVAGTFAPPPDGVLYHARVPASRILSLGTTGAGCINEREVILLGGPLQAEGHRRSQEKRLGGIALTPRGIVRWDPSLHPRDAAGRWTETLGRLGLPDDAAIDVRENQRGDDEDTLGGIILGSLLDRDATGDDMTKPSHKITLDLRREAKRQSAETIAARMTSSTDALTAATQIRETPAPKATDKAATATFYLRDDSNGSVGLSGDGVRAELRLREGDPRTVADLHFPIKTRAGTVFLPGTPEADTALREAAASALIAYWAGSSNGSAKSLAIQDAARAEFGLEGTADWHGAMVGDAAHYAAVATRDYGAVLRDFVRAQYDATQQWLRDHNIGPNDTITVYRGIGGKHDPPLGNDVTITTRPLSSWSYARSKAVEFAEDNSGPADDGVVYTAEVPASRILSLGTAGVGCLDEDEVIILGGPLTAEGHRLGA